ncbi:hypothetical protein [Bradyrhizobium sp. USDA 3458]|uniref:hypothetical protein n=1 Tax=Bradyrhizobium sp. USDA 3458 TaxID=2591461 RepID=UPI0011451B94|nr:hypothetical protein [Bradyrhizobium sp. USDA 3458]
MPPQSLSVLRQILARAAKMNVLIGHGLFDLIPPYFGSKMALDQLLPFDSERRVKFVVYRGGHMFYSRVAPSLRAETDAMMK